MLRHAVVVAGDGTRPDIGARPHLGIAEIAQVRGLGARVQGRVLDLDEVAEMHARLQHRAGAQAHVRADIGALHQPGVVQVREGADGAAVADDHAGAEHAVRLDDDVAPENRIDAQEHRLGRDQRRPAELGRPAQAGLDRGLGLAELHPVVDALRLRLGHRHHGDGKSVCDGQRHRVGEVVLAVGVVVADPLQEAEGVGTRERHQPGIGQAHRPLGPRGVLLLADRQHAAPLRQHPPVAGRVGGLEGQHRHRRALTQGRAQPRVGLGGDQRRVAEGDDHVLPALQRRTGGEHGMRRAEALGLGMDAGAGRHALDLAGDVLPAGLDHHGEAGGTGLLHGGQHVAEHGAVSEFVEHLGPVGAHPRPLARREHDRGEAALRPLCLRRLIRACRHRDPLPAVRECLTRCPSAGRPRRRSRVP